MINIVFAFKKAKYDSHIQSIETPQKALISTEDAREKLEFIGVRKLILKQFERDINLTEFLPNLDTLEIYISPKFES